MSEESTAAAMIRRFRQSRPTSRAEREIEKKHQNIPKEMWWVQDTNQKDNKLSKNKGFDDRDTIDSPEPEPSIKPTKQSTKSELLDSLDRKRRSIPSSIPIRVKKSDIDHEVPLDSMSKKAVGKLRDSLEIDDWIEKEIKSLENDMRKSNPSRERDYSKSPLRDRLGKSAYPLDDHTISRPRGRNSNNNNNNNSRSISPALNQSRISLNNSGNWLRGSNDTLGSIKGLLDEDLRLDGYTIKHKPKVISDDIPFDRLSHLDIPMNQGHVNNSLEDINQNLENLLANLRKEQANLPKLSDFDLFHDPTGTRIASDVDVTIPQITNQLQAHLIAFQAAFEIRHEDEVAIQSERKQYEENIREEGRKQEREKRILGLDWDEDSMESHPIQPTILQTNTKSDTVAAATAAATSAAAVAASTTTASVTTSSESKQESKIESKPPIASMNTTKPSLSGKLGDFLANTEMFPIRSPPSATEISKTEISKVEANNNRVPRNRSISPTMQLLQQHHYQRPPTSYLIPPNLLVSNNTEPSPTTGNRSENTLGYGLGHGSARDAAFIQAAMDAEFIAVNQAMHQMKVFRNQLHHRLQSLQATASDLSLGGLLPNPILSYDHSYGPETMMYQNAYGGSMDYRGNYIPWNTIRSNHSSTYNNMHESVGSAALDIYDKLDNTISDLNDKFPGPKPTESPSFPVMDAIYNEAKKKESMNSMIQSNHSPDIEHSKEDNNVSDPIPNPNHVPSLLSSHSDHQTEHNSVPTIDETHVASNIKRRDSLSFISDEDEEEYKTIHNLPEYKSQHKVAFQTPNESIHSLNTKETLHKSDSKELKLASFAKEEEKRMKKPPTSAGNTVAEKHIGVSKVAEKIPLDTKLKGTWNDVKSSYLSSDPIITELNKLDKILGPDDYGHHHHHADSRTDTHTDIKHRIVGNSQGLDQFTLKSAQKSMATHSNNVDSMLHYQLSQRHEYEAQIRKEQYDDIQRRSRAIPKPSAPPLPMPQILSDHHIRYPSNDEYRSTYTPPVDSYGSDSYRIRQPLEGQAISHIRKLNSVQNIPMNEISSNRMSVGKGSDRIISSAITMPSTDASLYDREQYLRQMQQLRQRLVT